MQSAPLPGPAAAAHEKLVQQLLGRDEKLASGSRKRCGSGWSAPAAAAPLPGAQLMSKLLSHQLAKTSLQTQEQPCWIKPRCHYALASLEVDDVGHTWFFS
uniref:Uncharacterized protein n=1 Tax=Sphaerodactylus townsendi TaxID=933632 RepID=A0ACB8FAM4_9SAUR